MIRGIFFDLDGTLVNSLADIGDAVNQALGELGLPQHSPEDYRWMVGNGMRKLCIRALPPGKEGLLPQLMERYRQHYLAHCRRKTLPYEGAARMLASLRSAGLALAVITNKPQPQALEVMTLLPQNSVDLIFGQQEPFPVKPDPASFFHVAEQLSVSPEQVIYCGDSAVDIQFAHNAGALGFGCGWGFRGAEELESAGADGIAASPAQLEGLILSRLSF